MIKDSGNRTKYKSGAVRDVQKGRGRCDLLPLDIVEEYIDTYNKSKKFESVLFEIDKFIYTGEYNHLINAVCSFINDNNFDKNIFTSILEYSIHLEEGCKKYDDRNWQKGMPCTNYIDSGLRHYIKFLRGDTDERHDRAFMWNMLCGAWTVKHKPELNSYPIKV